LGLRDRGWKQKAQHRNRACLATADSHPKGTIRTHRTKTARDALPDSAFDLPESRTYPMPDAVHARNAKARAAEEFNRGIHSADDRSRIEAKADGILQRP
jgi:hypothetical protein